MRRDSFRTRLLPLALLAALGIGALPTTAAAFRCGGDLVTEGDPAYRVRAACGAPDFVKPLHGYHGPGSDYGDELWYYNPGPNELVRELRFRDGRLARIRTGDRGFREHSEPGGCEPSDVRAGMTAFELRVRCGKPVQREARHVLRPLRRHGHLHGHHRVWLEDWYYEFGSQYLDRRVRLVDGRVESVNTVD